MKPLLTSAAKTTGNALARTNDFTHLAFHPKRGSTAINEIGIINQFTGTLVRDCFSAYRQYEQCRHSFCNAHLLRDLTFIGEAFPDNKNWTATFAKHLLEIKRAVENARAELLTTLDDSLQTDFLDRDDSILADAGPAVRGSPAEKNKLLSAPSLHRRLIRNKELILRFMTDFAVPFDNNGSERDLRMLKLQQRISACFRSVEGVITFCLVRSFFVFRQETQCKGVLSALESALEGQPVALTAR